MSYTLDWNNLPSSGGAGIGNGDNRPLNFIKFGEDTKHVIRPVGKAIGFWRFWYKSARKYITADVKIDNKGKVIESNLEELKELLDCEPEQRFAINVIDRSDSQIKILQGPMTIVQQFAEVAQETSVKPGSAKGGDWKITSTGNGKSRRYNCNFLGPKPFTKDELNRINNEDKTKNEWYSLENIYKPTNMEEIDKIIKGDTAPIKGKNSDDDSQATEDIVIDESVMDEVDF